LAACDVGASRPSAGEEALGFVAALQACGTTGLVASPVPLADGATRQFMAALHEHLSTGVDPAAALLYARSQMADAGPLGRLTAGSFVAYGTGMMTQGPTPPYQKRDQ